MKTLKKHKLKINEKFMYNSTVSLYKFSEQLEKKYCFTEATTAQLRKLDIPTTKACYGLNNAYGGHYFGMFGNLIRKKDVVKLEAYFATKKLKRNVDCGFAYVAKIYYR